MPRPSTTWRDLPLSDEAAAYTADILMQLALEFEATHFGQIRRHYEAMRPEPDEDPRQLELFPELSFSPFDRRRDWGRIGPVLPSGYNGAASECSPL
jgi:hypothetical protein